jgi:excisionase family DNA binding protein
MSNTTRSPIEALLQNTQRQVSDLLGPSFTVVVSITCSGTSRPRTPAADTLLTVDDVADRLRLARSTVREHMRTGKIRAHKRGRRWYTTSQTLLDVDL